MVYRTFQAILKNKHFVLGRSYIFYMLGGDKFCSVRGMGDDKIFRGMGWDKFFRWCGGDKFVRGIGVINLYVVWG